MSNFPQSNSPPGNYPPVSYQTPVQMRHPLAAARRAGVLLICLGVLMLLLAGCFALVGVVLGGSSIPPELQQQVQRMEEQSHATIATISLMFYGAAALVGAIALFQIVAGFLVRRGGRITITVAIVVTSILAVLWGLQGLGGVMGAGGGPNMVGVGFMVILGMSLLGWQLAWLLAARQSTPATSASGANWQQQQMAGFLYPPPPPGPGGVGWAYGSTPPPPPPMPSGSSDASNASLPG